MMPSMSPIAIRKKASVVNITLIPLAVIRKASDEY